MCTERKRSSELNLGLTLKTKYEGMDYDNLFGIGIPDIFMNMLSCQGFINNNDSIVILNVLIGCLNIILLKDSFN